MADEKPDCLINLCITPNVEIVVHLDNNPGSNLEDIAKKLGFGEMDLEEYMGDLVEIGLVLEDEVKRTYVLSKTGDDIIEYLKKEFSKPMEFPEHRKMILGNFGSLDRMFGMRY